MNRYYARDKDAISTDNQKGKMSLINANAVASAASSTQLQILAGNADGYPLHCIHTSEFVHYIIKNIICVYIYKD